MTLLQNYHHFAGTHWETGSVHNFFAYRGFKAPHSGQPYSEALLLGVSGGITVGYFNFAYEGYDPQCNILTRNTFDPWDTLLSRLGVIQNVEHTAKAARAAAILKETLADGIPAILWPDHWSLPYAGYAPDAGMWGAMPLLVYGFEDETADSPGLVYVADRARVGLTLTAAELAAARGRIKKDKHRLITLEAPQPDKLAGAVRLGICDTIQLFTEKPPKGSRNNFGLTGLQYWIKMLTQPKARHSWEKVFPAGRPLFAGLTSAYQFAFLFGKDLAQDAERGRYADFLVEAAQILDKPALMQAAERFRASAAAWNRLPGALLPDAVAPLAEARRLLYRRQRLFLEEGGASLAERRQIGDQLKDLSRQMETDFPLTAAEVVTLRQQIAAGLEEILAAESAAVAALQAGLE